MMSKIIKYFMIGLAAVIFVLSLTVYFQYKKLRYQETFSRVESQVQLQLDNLGLPVAERETTTRGIFPPHQIARIEVNIPLRYNLDDFTQKLTRAFHSSGVQVLNLKKKNLKDTYNIHLELGEKNVLTHRLLFSLTKAKVAILIDDFGYTDQEKLMDAFFKHLPVPFTISIIPGTQFASRIAEIAHHQEKQIIVHMPMQPEGKFKNQYRWIILDKMKQKEIKENTTQAIESIPYVQGLNNHMGSLVTTRRELIEPVLQILKNKNMFFVDSRTNRNSIAYLLAENLGVKSTFNCVFLDNKKDGDYIDDQFTRLISHAFDKGWAVGLGHSDITTAQSLQRMVKKCDERKIRFVPVSEVLK